VSSPPPPPIESVIAAARLTGATDADIDAALAEGQRRRERREKGAYVFADQAANIGRALFIAWAFDVLRPVAGLAWLPQVTWWQAWLILLILGMTAGSLTQDVLANFRAWRDVYAKPTDRPHVETHTYVNGVDVTEASAQARVYGGLG
jgi:hypothetical protein